MSAQAGTLAHPHFGEHLSGFQRRRLGRIMRDTYAPAENPLKRWLSAMGGYTEALAEKILAHSWGKTEYAKPAELYLAIGKEASATTDTGTSIEASKEANYTGYARLKLDLTKHKMTKISGAAAIVNELLLELAACSAGSNAIVSFWLTEKKKGEACNVVMWGSCTSVTIDSTHTPPVVAVEKLIGEVL